MSIIAKFVIAYPRDDMALKYTVLIWIQNISEECVPRSFAVNQNCVYSYKITCCGDYFFRLFFFFCVTFWVI